MGWARQHCHRSNSGQVCLTIKYNIISTIVGKHWWQSCAVYEIFSLFPYLTEKSGTATLFQRRLNLKNDAQKRYHYSKMYFIDILQSYFSNSSVLYTSRSGLACHRRAGERGAPTFSGPGSTACSARRRRGAGGRGREAPPAPPPL